MNQEDIKKIENSLKIKLPEFYKKTIQSYPFPKESFANEFLLPDEKNTIIENNDSTIIDKKNIFVVGSDGGEEYYYINLTKETSEVYLFDLEEKKSKVKSPNWDKYLNYISKTLKEIEEDEHQEKERKKNKKWWQFWI